MANNKNRFDRLRIQFDEEKGAQGKLNIRFADEEHMAPYIAPKDIMRSFCEHNQVNLEDFNELFRWCFKEGRFYVVDKEFDFNILRGLNHYEIMRYFKKRKIKSHFCEYGGGELYFFERKKKRMDYVSIIGESKEEEEAPRIRADLFKKSIIDLIS